MGPETISPDNPESEPIEPTTDSAARHGEIRKSVEDINRRNPDILHRDLRAAVISEMNNRYDLLSEAEQKEVDARVKNRFISKINIGEPGSSSCIDTPHGTPPEPSEVGRDFYEIPKLRAQLPERLANASRTEITAYIAGRAGQLMWIMEKQGINRGMLSDDWRSQFADSLITDPLDETIIDHLRTFEIYTSDIARKAAQLGHISSFVWRHSRISYDPNAPKGETYKIPQSRKESLEYAAESQHAGDLVLMEIMKQTSEVDENGKLLQPFLHLQLHRQFNSKERAGIIIADGIKGITLPNGNQENRTPCHPAVARLFRDLLQTKINEAGLKHPDGRPIEVSVAHEEMRMCGSSENVRRRYGGEVHEGFGDLYQCLQTEIQSELLKNFQGELANIIGVVVSEMHEKLPDENAYRSFIEEATEEERNAENGTSRAKPTTEKKEIELPEGFYTAEFRSPDLVPSGCIACNGGCRKNLGIYDSFASGEQMTLWVRAKDSSEWIQFKIIKAKSKFSGNDKPSFSESDSDKLGPVVEIRTTPPEAQA